MSRVDDESGRQPLACVLFDHLLVVLAQGPCAVVVHGEDLEGLRVLITEARPMAVPMVVMVVVVLVLVVGGPLAGFTPNAASSLRLALPRPMTGPMPHGLAHRYRRRHRGDDELKLLPARRLGLAASLHHVLYYAYP